MRPRTNLSAGLSGADQKAKNYADSALRSADKSAKGYADAAQSAAVKAANANAEELLKSYPTVTAMESAIKQNADSSQHMFQRLMQLRSLETPGKQI